MVPGALDGLGRGIRDYVYFGQVLEFGTPGWGLVRERKFLLERLPGKSNTRKRFWYPENEAEPLPVAASDAQAVQRKDTCAASD